MYNSLSEHSITRWPGAASRSCDDVIALVARQKKVPIRLLTHKNRSRNATVRARHLAMYLAHVVFGHSLATIGEAFGRDRTTVSYACARIEDMRDDPRFDAEVCALEQALETSGAEDMRHVG
jgi:chromosomal replication initiation ATPase DnaA